jgi:hypothetical protein
MVRLFPNGAHQSFLFSLCWDTGPIQKLVVPCAWAFFHLGIDRGRSHQSLRGLPCLRRLGRVWRVSSLSHNGSVPRLQGMFAQNSTSAQSLDLQPRSCLFAPLGPPCLPDVFEVARLRGHIKPLSVWYVTTRYDDIVYTKNHHLGSLLEGLVGLASSWH